MRLEYTDNLERNLRVAELEAILLNHDSEYSEEELDEMEKELEKLVETGYQIIP